MVETVTLNEREQKRLLVLNRVIGGQTMAKDAAGLLGLSVRQLRRILAAYRKEGAAALAHGNRGRKPANSTGLAVKERAVELAIGKYRGLNYQHLREKLEVEGIYLKPSTLRRIMMAAGVVSPRKRRPPKHRARRERYPQEGMLLQIDGSPHDWLEGRGPRLTLVAAIDDATGKVPYALFRSAEDSEGYFLLMRGIVERKGRPLAVYRDRHSIFETTRKAQVSLEEQLLGRQEPSTQFGRLLEELEITSIPALSPQAKGRIERLFGTLQDRLVAELRLAGATNLEEANRVLRAFLPEFDCRFGVKPAQEGSAYRPLPEKLDLEDVFCFKYPRTVAADNTLCFGKERLQLLAGPDRLSYARARVEVQRRLDGSLVVRYQGRIIPTRPAPLEARLLRARRGECPLPLKGVNNGGLATGQVESDAAVVGGVDKWTGVSEPVHLSTPHRRPASDHPWRNFFIQSNSRG